MVLLNPIRLVTASSAGLSRAGADALQSPRSPKEECNIAQLGMDKVKSAIMHLWSVVYGRACLSRGLCAPDGVWLATSCRAVCRHSNLVIRFNLY